MKYFSFIIFSCVRFFLSPGLMAQHPATVISGRIETGRLQDTVIIIVNGEFSHPGNPEFMPAFKKEIVTSNGSFSLTLPQLVFPAKVNFYLNAPRQSIHHILRRDSALINYFIEPGDNIHITGKAGQYSFSGKGAAKWEYTYRTDSIDRVFESRKMEYSGGRGRAFDYARFSMDVMFQKSDLLKEYERRIPADMLFIYRANLQIAKFTSYYTTVSLGLKGDSSRVLEAQRIYEEYLKNVPVDTARPDLLVLSNYPSLLLKKVEVDGAYLKSVGVATDPSIYKRVSHHYSGVLRDKMLMLQMDKDLDRSKLSDSNFVYLSGILETPRYRLHLKKLMESFATGTPVTDFDFRDMEDNIVRLSNFRGKVVFIDMWFTGCGGCIAVAKALPEVEEAFKGSTDIVFVSLSIDRDKKKWLESVDPVRKLYEGSPGSYTHYTTPSTTYLYTSGTGSYNDFIRKYNPGGSYPHLLLIGKDGTVFAADPPNPAYNDGKEKLIALIRKAVQN